MRRRLTSIRLDTELADRAAAALGVRTRTEAVHIALSEVAALRRFKDAMKEAAGKFPFAGDDERVDCL
jgi:Arc/MetJ family transcription regulator